MKVGFKSDIGKIRKTNEDSFYINEKLCLFIVADGMGGYQSGDVASRMAVETFSEYMISTAPLPSDWEDVYNIIMEAICKANEDIRSKAENNGFFQGMGTTIVSALCCKKNYYISHVGDSRAYLIRDGEIKQLTEDHSVVVKMVKAGIISREEARTHYMKNMITQALGTSDHLEPEIGIFEWKKYDYLLLCTDGLTDMLEDEDIRNTVIEHNGEPQKACDKLIELANNKGGRDNSTVVILYWDSLCSE